MRNCVRLLGSVALMAIVLTSCKQTNKESQSTETLTVENMGRSISFDKKLDNVVVFDVGAMENMVELGLPFKGMAKVYSPNYLSKYAEDDNIVNVGSFMQPNFEKISSVDPDLIIMSNWFDKDYSEYAKIAPTISLGISGSNYLASTKENIATIGQVFQVEEKAELLIKNIDDKVARIHNAIKDRSEKAMLILYNNKNYSVFDPESRYGYIFKHLGVKPSAEGIEGGSDHGNVVSSEFILEQNPDIIFIIDRGAVMDNQIAEKKEVENVLIQKTNAYKNGKIVYLDPNAWYLAGGGYISLNIMLDEIENAYK
ncbi:MULTISPECIES: siderophore ABC transporter substrate-binding protein [Myroides]|uniref:ABC transporter substrate-binding protein n=1 Tax=Myroides albus TaxID=2562892 RepID=A0A6I3LIF0_9FLAO|nr:MULTISPECIES: ABC transporter substrate-binding protein [Myroides]MTG97574.1 ABC transporter substrate-binding protein [Myroides albus]MVX36111.1 ABC transporter substrate-binding protein [Myroides sp. LoEW2-1]UVD81151.1 ABC transporter substrate-binding protein [Myroides albus]